MYDRIVVKGFSILSSYSQPLLSKKIGFEV